jgi:hypothetical protein
MVSYSHSILNHEQRKLIRQTWQILFSSRSRPLCPTAEPLLVSCPNRYGKMWRGGGGALKVISHLNLMSGLKFTKLCLHCLVRFHGVVLRIGTSVRVFGFSQHCSWGFKISNFSLKFLPFKVGPLRCTKTSRRGAALQKNATLTNNFAVQAA